MYGSVSLGLCFSRRRHDQPTPHLPPYSHHTQSFFTLIFGPAFNDDGGAGTTKTKKRTMLAFPRLQCIGVVQMKQCVRVCVRASVCMLDVWGDGGRYLVTASYCLSCAYQPHTYTTNTNTSIMTEALAEKVVDHALRRGLSEVSCVSAWMVRFERTPLAAPLTTHRPPTCKHNIDRSTSASTCSTPASSSTS